MNHMIIIRAGKIRTALAKAGAVTVILAGLAGMGAVAQLWLTAAVTNGVERAQEPSNWADECLDYARRHGVDIESCSPFLSPGEPADPRAVLTSEMDLASGFTYDAGSQGTMVRLPDGTTLYVPIQRNACPTLRLADSETEWCINWADVTPGDDNG